MASPPPPDQQPANASGEEVDPAIAESEAFNPLISDLNDLRLSHDDCWAWSEVGIEFQRLDEIVDGAHALLEPLTTADSPDWAVKAAIGISKSNLAIHQYAELRGSYIDGARTLWTTRVPHDPPTLSNTQIYALLAICEARLAAETYAEIAAGIEDEIEQAAVSHDDVEDINLLRSEIAGWERHLWHHAAFQTGTAEKFLLLAEFSASAPDSTALKKAETQVAKLHERATTAEAAAAPFRAGRKKGAVSKFTKALMVILQEPGNHRMTAVMASIRKACRDSPIEDIQFYDYDDKNLWYRDTVRETEFKISFKNLQKKILRLQQK